MSKSKKRAQKKPNDEPNPPTDVKIPVLDLITSDASRAPRSKKRPLPSDGPHVGSQLIASRGGRVISPATPEHGTAPGSATPLRATTNVPRPTSPSSPTVKRQRTSEPSVSQPLVTSTSHPDSAQANALQEATFNNIEDACNYAKTHAKSQGARLLWKYGNARLKVYLCHNLNQMLTNVFDQPVCPYEVYVTFLNNRQIWHVSESGEHNHPMRPPVQTRQEVSGLSAVAAATDPEMKEDCSKANVGLVVRPSSDGTQKGQSSLSQLRQTFAAITAKIRPVKEKHQEEVRQLESLLRGVERKQDDLEALLQCENALRRMKDPVPSALADINARKREVKATLKSHGEMIDRLQRSVCKAGKELRELTEQLGVLWKAESLIQAHSQAATE